MLPEAVHLEGEVGHDPAVVEGVVDDDRIAEVVGVAQVAEVALAHQVVEGDGRHKRTGILVEDAQRGIDGLQVVHRSHVAVGIGRMAGAARDCSTGLS